MATVTTAATDTMAPPAITAASQPSTLDRNVTACIDA
jgi:hypothetical protein